MIGWLLQSDVTMTSQTVLTYGISAVLAVLCYMNSLFGDFVHDDITAITQNPDVVLGRPVTQFLANDFWGRSMADPTSHKSYRPLTVITFRLNAVISGLNPIAFHLLNIVLHALVTVLLLRMCSTILKWKTRQLMALGIMFATHPIHTEAVAGIVGRADLLAGLLFLQAYIQYCKSLHFDWSSGSHVILPTNEWQQYMGCLVSGSLSMLAKEHGITVLGIIVCHELLVGWKVCRKNVFFFNGSLKCVLPVVQRILLLLMTSALLFSLRIWLMNGELPRFSEQDNPTSFAPILQSRFLTYAYLVSFNGWLLLLPLRLSYDWQLGSIPLVNNWHDSRNITTITFFIVLSLLIWYCYQHSEGHDHTSMFIGMSFLIIPFLPATNLVITVGFVVAERILYIPSFGYCILIVHGLQRLLDRYPAFQRIFYAAFIGMISVFILKTINRNRVWESRDTLLRSGLETLPHNAKMHYNFANLQKDLGNEQLAIHHYQVALRLWPNHASAHNNLGTLMSNVSSAEYHFLQAIRVNPRHVRAHFNLANLISTQGRRREAVQLMEHALRLDPHYKDASSILARLYADLGYLQDAEQLHQTLLTLHPNDADVYNDYGVFLQKYGRGHEALHYYQKAINLQINHTVALVNAARLLRTLQQTNQAEELYRKALEVQEDPVILVNLGILYFNTGRHAKAKEMYQKVLARDPNNVEAQVNHARVLIRERDYQNAEKELLTVIRANDSHREAMHQLANLYNHVNRTSEALHYILNALKLCSFDDVSCGQIYADYGSILKDVNDMDTAAESYRMAIQMNPNLSHAHLNLGVIYHIKHDFRMAWQHYRAAQILEPHNQLLLDNMEKLRRTELRTAAMAARDGSCS